MRFLIVLLSSFFITACNPFVKPSPTDTTVQIDRRLLELCPEVQSQLTDSANFEEVLKAKADDSKTYTKCAENHNKLVPVVRKYFNLNE